jgi:hypothetical protein
MALPEVTGKKPIPCSQSEAAFFDARGPPRAAYTLAEFCEAHRISRSSLHRLRKAGKGPDVTNVAGRRIITFESAARWRKQRTAASKKEAAA